jgi:hypothetical protein
MAMRTSHAVLVVMVVCTPHLAAQMLVPRAAQPKDSVPSSIAEAEAEGARWPRAVANNETPATTGVVGSSERRCMNVDHVNIARSGDFVAGPFQFYYSTWSGGYGKLWWQPAWVSRTDTATLTVRVARLDAHVDAAIFAQSFLTHGTPRGEHTRLSPDFYPSGIHVPSTGRWLLVATAGPNWGCYVLTVG